MTKAEIKNLNDVLRAGVEYGKENRITYTNNQNKPQVQHTCFYKWLKGKFNFKEKKAIELLEILKELNII